MVKSLLRYALKVFGWGVNAALVGGAVAGILVAFLVVSGEEPAPVVECPPPSDPPGCCMEFRKGHLPGSLHFRAVGSDCDEWQSYIPSCDGSATFIPDVQEQDTEDGGESP